jgi:hypothetical protein
MRALGIALLLAGCAHLPPAPGAIIGPDLPANLHCAESEHGDGMGRCLLYTSAQPTAAQFIAMHDKLRVGIVIKLNKPSLPFDGGRDVVPPGVEVWAHPWNWVGPVSHEQIESAVADLDSCVAWARVSDMACDLHCLHGVDRTRMLVAIWRVRHGVPAEAAWGEWRAFPRSKLDGWLYDTFENETGFHVPEDER